MKNKYFGHELRRGIETLAHKVCSALALRPVSIEWTFGTSTAGINAWGTMYLADIRDDVVVPASTFKRYCGFVVHELCHRKYTDFNSKSSIDYVFQLHNALEDAWIEHRAIDDGITGNVQGLLTDLIDQMVAEAMEQVDDWADPRQYPFALAVYARRHAANKVPLANGLQPIFDQAVRTLKQAKNSADTLLIAEWVYKQLCQLPTPPQAGKQPETDQQNAPQNAPESSESGDQGEGEGEGAGEAKDASEVGNAVSPAQCKDPANVEPTLEVAEGDQTGGSFNNDAAFAQNPDTHLLASDQPNPFFTVKTPVSPKLQHEVRRLFERTDISEWSRNHKAGSLNVHALPNLLTNSDRLFKRRFEHDGVDSAVVILMDVSSSMFNDRQNRDGKRIKNAVATCIAMMDTLTRAGVSVCVMAFSDNTSIVKPFGMPLAQGKKRVMRLRECGSTNDYYGVKVAHDVLRVRPEERKVLFVITDGDGDMIATHSQVAAGERLGITTIGVGVQLNVSGVYPNNIHVEDAADIGKASFKQIKLAA